MGNEPISPDGKRALRVRKERVFLCDRCGDIWPESSMKTQDGLTLCVENCFDEGGSAREKDARRALAAKLAVRATLDGQRPPKRPFLSDFELLPVVTSVPHLDLVRGAGPVPWTLGGRDLSSADTISGFPPEIAEAFPAVYAPDKSTVTLQYEATLFALRGDYDLIYNGNRFMNVLRVR